MIHDAITQIGEAVTTVMFMPLKLLKRFCLTGLPHVSSTVVYVFLYISAFLVRVLCDFYVPPSSRVPTKDISPLTNRTAMFGG